MLRCCLKGTEYVFRLGQITIFTLFPALIVVLVRLGGVPVHVSKLTDKTLTAMNKSITKEIVDYLT